MQPISVLHIEDDELDREFVLRVLGDDFQIDSVSSLQGIGYWLNPDFILLDLNLGSHEGLSVLRDCLGRFPRKPIVAHSGFTSEHARLEQFHEAIEFLPKSATTTKEQYIESMIKAAQKTRELNLRESEKVKMIQSRLCDS